MTPPSHRADPQVWRVGTLAYSLRGLLVLSLWLLWGDFAFAFFENIFGRFIPLYLKDLHASNTLIGIMSGSFAGLVNILFLPNISQWSDHYRSPLGRRIPFLYIFTPLTVFSLIAIGFAPEIATALHTHLLSHLAPSLAASTIALALLCLFVISYHFSNMVLVNAYNWLLRDVVPQELMARFLSWFRLVDTASACLFLWYVFPQIVTHRKEIFLGIGLFYLVAFLLMCLNVKEGAHPPPPPVEKRPGVLKSFALYFSECLRLPIYRNFFIVYVLGIMATWCAGPFSTLFTRDTLGLDMDAMGKIFAWGTAAAALVYFPIGWLCDRFTSQRVVMGGMIGIVVAALAGYFLVHTRESVLIYNLLFTLPYIGWTLGIQATTMTLFPEEKFGQFSSGLNVFGCGALIPGNYLIGKLMDLTHNDYRLTFLWCAVLFALALYPMIRVYRDWKSYGGPHHYTAPLPSP